MGKEDEVYKGKYERALKRVNDAVRRQQKWENEKLLTSNIMDLRENETVSKEGTGKRRRGNGKTWNNGKREEREKTE